MSSLTRSFFFDLKNVLTHHSPRIFFIPCVLTHHDLLFVVVVFLSIDVLTHQILFLWLPFVFIFKECPHSLFPEDFFFPKVCPHSPQSFVCTVCRIKNRTVCINSILLRKNGLFKPNTDEYITYVFVVDGSAFGLDDKLQRTWHQGK